MNILITGINGFIGKHLYVSLSQEHSVLGLDQRTGSQKHVMKFDLGKGSGMKALIKRLQPKKIDVIIHLGARISTLNNQNDLKVLEGNDAITTNVIKLALAIQPKKLIHASSIAVYPLNGTYDERSILDVSESSDALYGLSKINAEVFFDFYLGKIMDVVHLRMAQVVGPGMRKDRIIPVLIKEIQSNNTMTLYAQGKRVVNFVHVDDVMSAYQKVIKRKCKGIFNVGHKQNLTMLQVARKIAKDFGDKKTKIKLINKGRATKQCISSEKLRKRLNCESKLWSFEGII